MISSTQRKLKKTPPLHFSRCAPEIDTVSDRRFTRWYQISTSNVARAPRTAAERQSAVDEAESIPSEAEIRHGFNM